MREIPLIKGMGVALVDDDDYHDLMSVNWRLLANRTKRYAACTSDRHTNHTLMHRRIMKCPKGMQVDHIDGDGLNNTKANLRICTHQQNSSNKQKHRGASKYLGVWWDSRYKVWVIGVRKNGKLTSAGTYKNEVDAALARDRLAYSLLGEFAKLNFPHLLENTK